MEFKQAMVPLANVYDAYSGVCAMDSANTVIEKLSNAEAKRYQYALSKVSRGVTLNRKDLSLFDKIDAVTFEHHGMCLKDSQVTKARIKACNKYKKQFIDRDHLVDHMNCMFKEADKKPREFGFYKALAEFMVSRLGIDALYELHELIGKVEGGADLELLSKFEEVVSDELGLSIVSEDIKSAIDKGSKKFGIYFQNLQEVISH